MKKVFGLLLLYLGPILIIRGCIAACQETMDMRAGWTLIPIAMMAIGYYLTEGDLIP